MWNMLWPVLIIVLSNTFYHICQKSTPSGANPFGAMTLTYLVSAVICAAIFFFTAGTGNVGAEFKKLNWTSIVLGIVIIGLEIGNLFLYRNGWKVSAGSLVCNISLAAVLVFVGLLLYKETVTVKQIVGIVFSCIGLALITK